MKCFLLICLLLFSALPAFAEDSDWIGIYTFDEESWDETRVRTSYWFRLEVKETDGKLVGIYSDGINGAVSQRFEVSIKTESEFTGGELLFEMEQSTADGELVIYTIWRKMNLAVRTETGGAYGRKSVFFRKIYMKKH